VILATQDSQVLKVLLAQLVPWAHKDSLERLDLQVALVVLVSQVSQVLMEDQVWMVPQEELVLPGQLDQPDQREQQDPVVQLEALDQLDSKDQLVLQGTQVPWETQDLQDLKVTQAQQVPLVHKEGPVTQDSLGHKVSLAVLDPLVRLEPLE
jgi:hypothetical protein